MLPNQAPADLPRPRLLAVRRRALEIEGDGVRLGGQCLADPVLAIPGDEEQAPDRGVDTEDDPDNPGKQRFVFTSVEGFVPPSSVELATTATENPTPSVGEELPPPELV